LDVTLEEKQVTYGIKFQGKVFGVDIQQMKSMDGRKPGNTSREDELHCKWEIKNSWKNPSYRQKKN
jgi:hypothetical protein